MKIPFMFAFSNLIVASLLIGTSSCTSESKNASTTNVANQSTVAVNPSTSTDPLTNLKEGNERFFSGKTVHYGQDTVTIHELAKGQNPRAIIIGCSDSRVSPEIVFDQGLGDLFTIRTAGNVMSDYEMGSIEYAAEHLHTKLIVVMGHKGCGAVAAMLEHKHDDNVPGHIASIVKALKDEPEIMAALKSEENQSDRAIIANIQHGVKQLRSSEPILSELYKENKIQIVGAIYDLGTGKVEFLDF